jgi:SAM-dependent methyltransferase
MLFHNTNKMFYLLFKAQDATSYSFFRLLAFEQSSNPNMSTIQLLKKKLNPRNLKRVWLSYALKGNNVECACCGGKYVTFLPAGIVKRANAACPGCSALERHRIIWLYLKNETNIFSAKLKMMHVAPEKLFYNKFHELGNIDYTSIDLYPDKYDYGSKTIQMDLTDLKFADNTFDVVICNHVLEHVPNDAKAMSEMFRVLKPGGWAVLNVPVDNKRETTFEDVNINDPEKQLELFGQPDHVRIYGKDYVDRLKKAGFSVQVFDYTEKFSHNEMFRHGIIKDREVYLCTKN